MNQLPGCFFDSRYRFLVFCFALLLALTPVLSVAAQTGEAPAGPRTIAGQADLAAISPALIAEGQRPDSMLIILDEQVDLERFAHPSSVAAVEDAAGSNGRARHIARLYAALTETALRSQAPVRAWLDARGLAYRPFYIVNMIEVRLDTLPEAAAPLDSLLDGLRRIPEVDRIVANPRVDARHNLGEVESVEQEAGSEPEVVASQYGLGYTGATTVWKLGYRGEGIVVANQDTGVQWDHPALRPAYRGWDATTQSASHPYNWFDAWADAGPDDVCTDDPQIPCDDHGHGTHTTGTLVADAGGEIGPLGMAPAAQWIGCRNMLHGFGRPSTYAACFEFFLAPYPQNGDPFTDGRPELAPHIISNSWGCPPSEGCDVDSLRQVVETARAAGQLVVSSAGNDGPFCGSVNDPIAIHDATFTVGAHNTSGDVAGFSGRGPVTVDGSNRLKPDIVAPGVGIYSTYRFDAYASLSGTSMAAPHVAGAAALLWSAVPSLVGNVDLTEQLLIKSATPVLDSQCNDGPEASPNHAYGFGRLNVAAAVEMALNPGRLTVRAADHANAPAPDVPVRVVDQRTGYVVSGTTDAEGVWTTETIYEGDYLVSIENNRDACGPVPIPLKAGAEREIDQAHRSCLILPLIQNQ